MNIWKLIGGVAAGLVLGVLVLYLGLVLVLRWTLDLRPPVVTLNHTTLLDKGVNRLDSTRFGKLPDSLARPAAAK